MTRTATKRRIAFAESEDPRELPTYAVPEAARYLRIPPSTLRSWAFGRRYATRAGKRARFQPILSLPREERRLFSFHNLVEAHILDAIRREHGVSLQKVRISLDYLRGEFGSRRPLLEQSFQTNGIDLFTEKYGRLINISRAGQLAMREVLEAHLKRIERDSAGIPIRLFPFTRNRGAGEPRTVVIDPRIAFGRPVLAGTGIPTLAIAERCKAGESIRELARDFGREPNEILEAIRCELQLEAA